MNGSLVYSNTAITSTDGEISINHHTSGIHVFNANATTDATIKLNGIHQIVIPHTPNQAAGQYVCIYGDYTKIQVVTSGVTLSIFAIG
jgi:hypothetical protein